MNPSFESSLKIPENTVLDFIRYTQELFVKFPYRTSANDEYTKRVLQLIHHFTYLKFHPYTDYSFALSRIKLIKEIDTVEKVTKKETVIITKKNLSTIPACEFILKMKGGKWKINDVRVIQGKNNYYSLFNK